MTRQRLCSNPRPEHGGHNCTGNSLEYKSCQQGPCNGEVFVVTKITKEALLTYIFLPEHDLQGLNTVVFGHLVQSNCSRCIILFVSPTIRT